MTQNVHIQDVIVALIQDRDFAIRSAMCDALRDLFGVHAIAAVILDRIRALEMPPVDRRDTRPTDVDGCASVNDDVDGCASVNDDVEGSFKEMERWHIPPASEDICNFEPEDY